MSVLRTLSEQDGWVAVTPPADDDGNTAGQYRGDPINCGFQSSESGQTLNGDPYTRYQSGPYTIEVRETNSEHLVRVSQQDVADRTYTRTPYAHENGYEVYLPAPLARYTGLNEPDPDADMTGAGKPVLIELELRETAIAITFETTAASNLDAQNVRRVQRKTNGEYNQYYVNFPAAVFDAIGVTDHQLTFTAASEQRLVATLPTDATDADGAMIQRCDSVTTVPASTQAFMYETFEGNPNATETRKLSADRIISLTTSATDGDPTTYADTDFSARLLTPTLQADIGTGKLTLRDEQARGLQLIPQRKPELVDAETTTTGRWFVEPSEYGFAVVYHPDDTALQNADMHAGAPASVRINNLQGTGTSNESLAQRYDRAGNQVQISFPRSLGDTFDLFGTELYWWAAEDPCYGTDKHVLIGLPLVQIPDNFHDQHN